MSSLLLFIGLLGVFGLFGYLVATRILRVRDAAAAWGMTLFLGESFFTMFSNWIGYILPIGIVFWLVVGIMCIAIFASMIAPKTSQEHPPKHVIWALWVFAIVCGVTYMRSVASDWYSLIHYPVPATILEGNFPIRDPFNPWTSYGYHYAPMLLAAGMSALSGVSLAVSYAIQPFLHACSLVFFAASLGRTLTKSWNGALLIALLTTGATGFHWLFGFSLLRDLFANDLAGASPLRHLSYMFGSIRVQPLVSALEHRAVGMGIAATAGSLHALYAFVEAHSRRERLSWLIIFLLFGAVLALSLESTFVVLLAGIVAMMLLYKCTSITQSSVLWLGAFLILVTGMSILQGGVITSTLTFTGDTRPAAFVLTWDGRYHFSSSDSLAFWDPVFLRDAGFTFLLLPIAGLYAWKKRKETWLPFFVAGIAAAHFFIPFFVGFPDRPHSMDRVMHLGAGLSAFLIGWWLWETLFRSRSAIQRQAAWAITATMLLSTALHLPVRLVFPDLKFEQRSFLPEMPERTEGEKQMHTWISEHTKKDDVFFFTQKPNPSNPTHDPDFAYFVAFTGRFLVKHGFNTDTVVGKDAVITAIESSCDIAAVRELGIRYIVVATTEQKAWFRHCQQNLFTKAYDDGDRVIYRLSR